MKKLNYIELIKDEEMCDEIVLMYEYSASTINEIVDKFNIADSNTLYKLIKERNVEPRKRFKVDIKNSEIDKVNEIIKIYGRRSIEYKRYIQYLCKKYDVNKTRTFAMNHLQIKGYKKGRNLEYKNNIIQEYNEGKTIKEIAENLHISKDNIRYILKEFSFKLTRPIKQGKRRILTKEEKEEIKKLYKQGLPISKIRQTFKTSNRKIIEILKNE